MNKTIQMDILGGACRLEGVVISTTSASISVVFGDEVVRQYKQYLYDDFNSLKSFGAQDSELVSFQNNLQTTAEHLRDAGEVEADIEDRYADMSVYFKEPWIVGTDAVDIQLFIMKELKDPEYYYIDNWRLALVGHAESEQAYNEKRKQGCCGFYDEELKTKSGNTYKVGFNYGH